MGIRFSHVSEQRSTVSEHKRVSKQRTVLLVKGFLQNCRRLHKSSPAVELCNLFWKALWLGHLIVCGFEMLLIYIIRVADSLLKQVGFTDYV